MDCLWILDQIEAGHVQEHQPSGVKLESILQQGHWSIS